MKWCLQHHTEICEPLTVEKHHQRKQNAANLKRALEAGAEVSTVQPNADPFPLL